MADVWPFIAPMPLLILLSGLASGSETALFSLSAGDRDVLRKRSPAAAAAIDTLLASPSRVLILVLLVNMIANVAYFVLGAVASTRASDAVSAAVIGVGSVLAIIVFGEVFAKLIARSARLGYCGVFGRGLLVAQRLATPVIVVIETVALEPARRLIGAKPMGGRGAAADLMGLVLGSAARGDLRPDEERLLRGVLELGHARAEDVMTPRVDAAWIKDDASADRVVDVARRTGADELVVCDGSADLRVLGVLDVPAYLDAAAEERSVGRMARRALFVPERATLDSVFASMRSAGATSAVCVDEYGAFVGVLRPEDVADELLEGLAAGEASVRLVGLGVWEVAGSTPLRELSELLGPEAVSRRSRRTLGGLVADLSGRAPVAGDTVSTGPVTIEVVDVEGGRVLRAMVRMNDPEDGSVGGGEAGHG